MAGSITVNATVIDEPAVNDAAILEGMPRTLSEFRFFTDGMIHHPNYQVTGYELNTPLYSDGADKLRFVYLPEGTVLMGEGGGLLKFPVGSAIIKTFAFGEGEDRRLIETRVLLHRTTGWVALPYRWNEDQTDAKLALAGARIPMTRPDGEEISYRIPNKNQCKTCHSKDGEVIPIGPKARNLPSEWLAQMVDTGHLSAVPSGSDVLPHWTDREGAETADLARAYLDVNCAHCHQPGGGASNSGLDLRWEQYDQTKLGIRKPPVAAGRGAGGHAVSIAPGDPDASILVYRMSSTEAGVAMPELGRSTNDPDGIAVVRKWIEEMPAS
nr:SO2930 family diheme c-type cytochrome [Erythrobacter crassostrea]